jgi:hypothetical protein
VVTEVYAALGCPSDQIPCLQRNTIQAHKGGYDIVGLDWIALEVKHQEKLAIGDWWEQTTRQAQGGKEPVLFYKQNNVRFRVVMLGQIEIPRTISEKDGGRPRRVRCPVDISTDVFLIYFRERLLAELGYTQGMPNAI